MADRKCLINDCPPFAGIYSRAFIDMSATRKLNKATTVSRIPILQIGSEKAKAGVTYFV